MWYQPTHIVLLDRCLKCVPCRWISLKPNGKQSMPSGTEQLRVRTKLLQYFSGHFNVILWDVEGAHRKELIKSFADKLFKLAFCQHPAARRVLFVCFLTFTQSSLRRRRRRHFDELCTAATGDRRRFVISVNCTRQLGTVSTSSSSQSASASTCHPYKYD